MVALEAGVDMIAVRKVLIRVVEDEPRPMRTAELRRALQGGLWDYHTCGVARRAEDDHPYGCALGALLD